MEKGISIGVIEGDTRTLDYGSGGTGCFFGSGPFCRSAVFFVNMSGVFGYMLDEVGKRSRYNGKQHGNCYLGFRTEPSPENPTHLNQGIHHKG